MAEDKAGKATAFIALPYQIVCLGCRFTLPVKWEGETLVASHEYLSKDCPHAGKKFKAVSTVELEELQ